MVYESSRCKLQVKPFNWWLALLLAVSGRGPAAWFIAQFAATLQQEELLCTGQLDTCSAYLLSLLGRRHYFGTCQVQSNRLTAKLLLKIFKAQQPTFKKARWKESTYLMQYQRSTIGRKEGDFYWSPYIVWTSSHVSSAVWSVVAGPRHLGHAVTLLRDSRDMLLITVTVLCKLCHFHFSSSSR